MPEIRGLDHVGVMVADLDQASSFLAETLGLELDREAEIPALDVRTRFYRCGPITIEVFQPNDPAVAQRELGAAPGKIEHIAVQVGSLPQAMEELAGQGVAFKFDDPIETGPNLSTYTLPETSQGMIFQIFAPKDG